MGGVVMQQGNMARFLPGPAVGVHSHALLTESSRSRSVMVGGRPPTYTRTDMARGDHKICQ